MSMQSWPSAGYLVEADKLALFFPLFPIPMKNVATQSEYLETLENDEEKAAEMLRIIGIPVEQIFTFNELADLGDPETMQLGVPYACFDVDTLYERKERKIIDAFKLLQIPVPQFSTWAMLG